MLFKETVHGSVEMDNLIREMQIQILNGEYSNLAFQEMRIILDEMQDKYANMSENDKLLEELRIALVETCYPISDEMYYIENLDGTECVAHVLRTLTANEDMIENFFSTLSDMVGSQIFNIIKYEHHGYQTATFNQDCTLNELLGIRQDVTKTQDKLVHEVDSEVLESILEDITGACVGINSIQRYNLFDAIAKHIENIRKDNPA